MAKKSVMTVTGPVGTDELGSVLMHEHLSASSMGVATHYPQLYVDGYKERMIKDMKDAKAGGISTLVEATPVCLGRDVRLMKEVSEAAGMTIIATSGWWGNEPPYPGPITPERLARCFIDDIRIGCDGTDIKAGILKAAMDKPGPTEWKKVTHRAVGMANVETGVKIILHTYCPTETPRHQLALLKEVGVDMNDVAVDHIPETTDLDFVKWIYDQGAWLGIDRLPNLLMPGEYAVAMDTRIKFIKVMLDAGMGDRMLFSHDISSCSTLFDFQPPEVLKMHADMVPDRFLYLKKHIFPKLGEMGVDTDMLWNMTIENPRRFFEG